MASESFRCASTARLKKFTEKTKLKPTQRKMETVMINVSDFETDNCLIRPESGTINTDNFFFIPKDQFYNERFPALTTCPRKCVKHIRSQKRCQVF